MINTKNAIGKMLSRGPKLNIDRYSKNKRINNYCEICGKLVRNNEPHYEISGAPAEDITCTNPECRRKFEKIFAEDFKRTGAKLIYYSPMRSEMRSDNASMNNKR